MSDEYTNGTDQPTKLQWCSGCQASVTAIFGQYRWECPHCGNALKSLLALMIEQEKRSRGTDSEQGDKQ